MAFWVGYAFSFWNYGAGVDAEWRLSLAMQFVPALLFIAGAPFLPERLASLLDSADPQLTMLTSPRWLVEHDRLEDAGVSLMKLRGANSLADVQTELDEIHANILWHKEHSINSAKVLFKNKALFARLWRAWTLAFLQQMSGAAGIRYYLPTNFIAAGTSEEISLLASGIDGTVQVACTIGAMFFIDRIGRRHSLGIGAVIMAFCLMVSLARISKREVLLNI